MTKRSVKVAQPLFPNQDKLLENIKDILSTGRLMNGKYTERFEKMFADKMNVEYAVSVNSCTTALEIVLKFLNVEGAQVIVPTNTFVATANAVLFAGGEPVLADVKEHTYFLNPDALVRLINNKTKAVIVVHIAGLIPPEIDEIVEVCRKKEIPLIEDCAHAMGASYGGKIAGTFGLAGCFSFYPTKIITTGTGGMIATDNEELWKFARSVRVHGAGDGLTDIVHIGNDWFLDEIRCAVGINQLEHFDTFVGKRREIATFYDVLIASEEYFLKFPVDVRSQHAYYKYPVQIQAKVNVPEMKGVFPEKYGFELESVYWPTCHLQPVYQNKFGYRMGMFPNAEAILSRQITLPIHASITKEEAIYTFECLKSEIDRMVR